MSKPYSTERRDVAQEVTDKIVAALEAGTAPWVKPWSTVGVTDLAMPRNAVSKRPYSGVNVLLLWIEAEAKGYKSNEWLTYRQAQGLGGNVRRGEKGTLVTLYRRIEIADEDAPNGRKTIPLLRGFVVFNRDQCDGLPAPKTKAPVLTPVERVERAEAFLKATGAAIREDDGQGRACYVPSDDVIRLPGIGRFVDAGAFYATALHEVTHWTGHESRCNRKFGARFGDAAYAAEELVAELGSAFLCATLGLDGTLRHAEYLGEWVKMMRADKKAVFTASSKAREAVEWLRSKTGMLTEESAPEETAAEAEVA